jgi:hypothetical protein
MAAATARSAASEAERSVKRAASCGTSGGGGAGVDEAVWETVGVRDELWLREPVVVPVLLGLSDALGEGKAEVDGADDVVGAAEFEARDE